MAKSKKQKGYGSQLAAVAPAFALKALIGDLPKGGIEKAVESKVSGSRKSTRKLLTEGLKGRGSGRAIGAGIGIATAPLFLKGLKLVGSKNESDKIKGLALLGSSAAGYQGIKGLSEGYREARVANLSKSKSIIEGLRLGGIRIGYKTPAALALGLSVAAGRKKSKDGKEATKVKKLLVPALGGALVAAASRGGEGLAKDISKGTRVSKALKKVGPRAAGGAAGGLLGGLVLGGVIDSAMKSLEKKGSVEDLEKQASLLTHLVALPAIHAATKAGFGYGRLGTALSKTPGLRGIVGASEKAKQKQLALGIREGIAGRQGAGFRTGLAFNSLVPELKMNREIGISAGKALRGLPPELRGRALDAIAGAVKRNPASRFTKGGEPVPILNQLPGAVDMALGRKQMSGNKLLNTVLYGGRGGLGTGLPTAGRQDVKAKGVFTKDNIANALSTGGGLAALGMAGPGAGGLLLGGLGAHTALSGIKNFAAKSNFVRNKGLEQGAMGIREAFLPGMNKTWAQRMGDHAMDIGISPASRDFGKMIGGIGRGVAESGRRGVGNISFQKYVNRAAAGHNTGWKDTMTPALLAGVGLAGIHNLKNPSRKRASD